jgi:hypothetical protein
MEGCGLLVTTPLLRDTASPPLSSAPFLSSVVFASFDSRLVVVEVATVAVGLGEESSHREKLKFEVARDGMNRSACPTSLRYRLVKVRGVLPDEKLP